MNRTKPAPRRTVCVCVCVWRHICKMTHKGRRPTNIKYFISICVMKKNPQNECTWPLCICAVRCGSVTIDRWAANSLTRTSHIIHQSKMYETILKSSIQHSEISECAVKNRRVVRCGGGSGPEVREQRNRISCYIYRAAHPMAHEQKQARRKNDKTMWNRIWVVCPSHVAQIGRAKWCVTHSRPLEMAQKWISNATCYEHFIADLCLHFIYIMWILDDCDWRRVHFGFIAFCDSNSVFRILNF